MHEASALVAGGTVDAARAVRSGEAEHAVNLAGGLHHAMPAKAYHPWDAGEGDPDDPIDRAIAASRRAVFPEHGLDPTDPR